MKDFLSKITFEKVVNTLIVKGLDPDAVPADFAAARKIRTRNLAKLTERQSQDLLNWLNEIPDDQPALSVAPLDNAPDEPADQEAEPQAPAVVRNCETCGDGSSDERCGLCIGAGSSPQDDYPNWTPRPAAGPASAGEETEGQPQASAAEPEPDPAPDGNGELKEQIRKAEEEIWIKRPLSIAELAGSLDELYKLAERRRHSVFNMESYKLQAKTCQKEIDTIDSQTYSLLREMDSQETQETEEMVPAIRVTNLTTGMIAWYRKDNNEFIREKAIKPGEQLPLDLSGDANATADEPPAVERSCETCAHDEEEIRAAYCNQCNNKSQYLAKEPIPANEPPPPTDTVKSCDNCARCDGIEENGCTISHGCDCDPFLSGWEPITPPAETSEGTEAAQ
jgi:hypothetical protein